MTALLLGYRDLPAARQFLCSALGFKEQWAAYDAEGSLSRSHVALGDTLLMLDKPGAHGVLNPSEAGGVTHLVVVTVDELDAHHRRAVGAGARVLSPPTDRPWGRDYEVIDPEGYVFSFISSTTAP